MAFLRMADGTSIHVEDRAARDDTAVVLLHGEPLSSWFWQKNIDPIAHACRVVAPDARGRGSSGKPEHGHDIPQFARDLHEILDALRIRKMIGVGWSIGSSVLWSYVEQFGLEHLAGFVNVDQRPYRWISEDHLARLLDEVRRDRGMVHARLVRQYLGPEFEHDDVLVRRMVAECMQTPTSAHLATLNDTYRRDFRQTMLRTAVPTQIFVGRYGLIGPEQAERMRADLRGEIVRFERSGHMLPWTEAERFNERVIAFAERIFHR